jgi:hypothetical protein
VPVYYPAGQSPLLLTTPFISASRRRGRLFKNHNSQLNWEHNIKHLISRRCRSADGCNREIFSALSSRTIARSSYNTVLQQSNQGNKYR